MILSHLNSEYMTSTHVMVTWKDRCNNQNCPHFFLLSPRFHYWARCLVIQIIYLANLSQLSQVVSFKFLVYLASTFCRNTVVKGKHQCAVISAVLVTNWKYGTVWTATKRLTPASQAQ